MKKTTPSLLLHPFFITSLLLLLLNDFVLKQYWHNWLTGKLSDVAGVAAFAIFFTAVFPARKKWAYAFTVIIFAWFKSPMSQPFINYCSAIHIPINRVVDYTDDVALLILFLTWQLKPLETFTTHKKIATYLLGGTSIFAFCATSAPRYLQSKENNLSLNKYYKTIYSEEQVLKKLDSLHIDYIIDSFETEKVYLLRGSYYFTRKDSLTGKLNYIYLPTDLNTNLYNRYSTIPYIAIKDFNCDGLTIPVIKIRIEEDDKKKKYYINLLDAQLSDSDYKDYVMRPGFDRRAFSKRIRESLIQKLQ